MERDMNVNDLIEEVKIWKHKRELYESKLRSLELKKQMGGSVDDEAIDALKEAYRKANDSYYKTLMTEVRIKES